MHLKPRQTAIEFVRHDAPKRSVFQSGAMGQGIMTANQSDAPDNIPAESGPTGDEPTPHVGTERDAPPATGNTARRILKNTASPFVASLGARVLSWGLAIVMARTIGPGGTGDYAIAVNLWLYASIIADFGLGTWLTREIARARNLSDGSAHARTVVASTLGIRLVLSAVAAILMGLLATAGASTGRLSADLAWTIVLLAIGLIPGAVSASGSAVFNAYERMAFPSAMQLVSGGLSTVAGVIAILAGHGTIGLAAVSLLTNMVSAMIFAVAVRRTFFPLAVIWPDRTTRSLATDTVPLMLNNLLNNVFFRIDVQILGSWGRTTVGQYASAYKIIDGVGAVPSSFVLALFPILSRRAGDADGALARIYRLALTILVAIAIPVATLLTWTAYPISRLLWGETFLPESARALQILIWFLPLSFINGLTQYVLIALGLQSQITVAFAIAAAFNLAANLILIPSFGYRAAAVVTIATEAVLLAPFVRVIGSRIPLNTLAVAILRPVPAAILFAGIIVAITPLTDWGAGILACAVYPLALWFGGAITPDDRELLRTVVRQPPSTGAS